MTLRPRPAPFSRTAGPGAAAASTSAGAPPGLAEPYRPPTAPPAAARTPGDGSARAPAQTGASAAVAFATHAGRHPGARLGSHSSRAFVASSRAVAVRAAAGLTDSA